VGLVARARALGLSTDAVASLVRAVADSPPPPRAGASTPVPASPSTTSPPSKETAP